MKIPQYIDNIIGNNRLKPIPAEKGQSDQHALILFGMWPRGYEHQLTTNVEKLIAWAKRNGAEAYIVESKMWYDIYDTFREAVRVGYRNHFIIVIGNPVYQELMEKGYINTPV